MADAVEGDAEEEELNRSAIEATQRTLESNVHKALLDQSRDQNGKPLPYLVQGPWTAKDRDQLERMMNQKLPWSVIARALQRNQESCKEKWLRMQKVQLEKTRQSKKIRGEQWSRLFKEGFTPHHRDQLVRAVEKHLKAKRKVTTTPLGFLESDEEDLMEGEEDSSAYGLGLMGQAQQQQNNNNNSLGNPIENLEVIDWDSIAKTLNKKFTADRLRSIYYELAATKLIWTPEEDERLTRAVIRLGPPELQPRIWTMIKEAFDDVVRTSDDYKDRWRILDMPQSEREWDFSEKKKFWRRWMDYHSPGSLLALKPFSNKSSNTPPESKLEVDQNLLGYLERSGHHHQSEEEKWDLIAEGLEYRHGRDCQLYFQQATFYFPKDPDLFRHLTNSIAKMYLKPRRVYWSPESLRLLVATVNKFLKTDSLVRWNSVAKVLGDRYTTEQCESKWHYWSQRHDGMTPTKDAEEDEGHGKDLSSTNEAGGSETTVESGSPTHLNANDIVFEEVAQEPRLWTDRELELLKQGVQEYGLHWAKIREAFLPHRTVQMLYERHWRDQAKRTGRFSEKERNLLETAIETYGEDADWALIASQVPGRSASQCRKNWNYSQTHHVHKLGEPWTANDRERLKIAVGRFGKKWSLVSEFVVGKTPDRCRIEWREKMDKRVNRGPWTDEEVNKMMERISQLVGLSEAKERALAQEHHTTFANENGTDASKKKNTFVDPEPRFKGRRRIDWSEVARAMSGRTAEQCRVRFETNRQLYRMDI